MNFNVECLLVKLRNFGHRVDLDHFLKPKFIGAERVLVEEKLIILRHQ